jgi:hypothetical protein
LKNFDFFLKEIYFWKKSRNCANFVPKMSAAAANDTESAKKRKESPNDASEAKEPPLKKAKTKAKGPFRLDLLSLGGDDDYGALTIENTIGKEGAYTLALDQGGVVHRWPIKYRRKIKLPKKKKEDKKKKEGESSDDSDYDSGEYLDNCDAVIRSTFTFSTADDRDEAVSAVNEAVEEAQDYDHSKHSTVFAFPRDGNQLEEYEDEEGEEEDESGDAE